MLYIYVYICVYIYMYMCIYILIFICNHGFVATHPLGHLDT